MNAQQREAQRLAAVAALDALRARLALANVISSARH